MNHQSGRRCKVLSANVSIKLKKETVKIMQIIVKDKALLVWPDFWKDKTM